MVAMPIPSRSSRIRRMPSSPRQFVSIVRQPLGGAGGRGGATATPGGTIIPGWTKRKRSGGRVPSASLPGHLPRSQFSIVSQSAEAGGISARRTSSDRLAGVTSTVFGLPRWMSSILSFPPLLASMAPTRSRRSTSGLPAARSRTSCGTMPALAAGLSDTTTSTSTPSFSGRFNCARNAAGTARQPTPSQYSASFPGVAG